MGLYEAVKDVAKLAQQADNIDLYRRLLDLSAQALDMQDEIKKEIYSISSKYHIVDITIEFD